MKAISKIGILLAFLICNYSAIAQLKCFKNINWFNFSGEDEIENCQSPESNYQVSITDSITVLSMRDYTGLIYQILKIESINKKIRVIKQEFKKTILTEHIKLELYYKHDKPQEAKNLNFLIITSHDSIYSFMFDYTLESSIKIVDDEIIVDLSKEKSSVMYMNAIIKATKNIIHYDSFDLKLNSTRQGKRKIYKILSTDFRFSFWNILEEDFEKNELLKKLKIRNSNIDAPNELRFQIDKELASYFKD